MDETDFDIENYDIEELAAILKISNFPINESKVVERVMELENKFTDERYINFFKKAGKKLIEKFNQFNEETWKNAYKKDTSEGARVLQEQYQELTQEEQENKYNQLLEQNHVIIGKEKKTLIQNIQTKDITQGEKNPLYRREIKRIINFDSHYREILDPDSVPCPDISKNTSKRLYTSTNYTVDLNEPLTNVIDIVLKDVNIPHHWYVFDKDYGTTQFIIDVSGGATKTITIDDGDYLQDDLITEINSKIVSMLSGINISFSYKPSIGRLTITNSHTEDITITWYPMVESIDSCSENTGSGGRANYNLGWLLGFHEDTSIKILKGVGTVTAGSIINVTGPNYFLLTLDDFNNNKPNKDLISFVGQKKTLFKMPAYYNSQTMDPTTGIGNFYPGHEDEEKYSCIDVADVSNNDRGCSNTDLNIDLRSNLTKAQQQTVDSHKLANKSRGIFVFSAPNATDLLGKIPVSKEPMDWNKKVAFKNLDLEGGKREYFGPVKLSKFKIRLLTDKGLDVNLHDNDWNFSIVVTQIYQF
jgi:hypothetical protein